MTPRWQPCAYCTLHSFLALARCTLPSPTVQANVDGGNGFIGTSGFFGWNFYTQDSGTGPARGNI